MGGPDNEFGWDQLWGGVLQGFDGRAPEAVQFFFAFMIDNVVFNCQRPKRPVM